MGGLDSTDVRAAEEPRSKLLAGNGLALGGATPRANRAGAAAYGAEPKPAPANGRRVPSAWRRLAKRLLGGVPSVADPTFTSGIPNSMSDAARTEWRQLSTALALALVALRFCAGLHFYSEGTKKLAYNSGARELRVQFSAEGFLKQAVGPLAGFFQGFVPGFYDWQSLLSTPRSALAEGLPTAAGEQSAGDRPPYAAWMEQVAAGFQRQQAAFARLSGVTEDQVARSKERLEFRLQQMRDYLAGESSAIAEFQHELWRLAEWEAAPEAAGLPFQEERIAEKRAELSAQPLSWVRQVEGIQRGLQDDLRGLVTPEQDAKSNLAAQVSRATADPRQVSLERMNKFITAAITGIGVCLMLGLLTRLAALGGAAFLLMVMATQPPWVEGAVTTMFFYQLVEVAALAVLAVAGAGQWAGIDALIRRWLLESEQSR
jgi:uncharacterized membrane protein YphA (DoxX/SURF4 family)